MATMQDQQDYYRKVKTTTFEGGHRIPCIMRWPGKIPAGKICREFATTMDLLPTLTSLTNATLPEKQIDGKDIWPMMSSPSVANSPHEAFYYYNVWTLEAIRSSNWKLHLPHKYFSMVKPGTGGIPGVSDWKEIDLSLFDLENDPGEHNNVSDEHPEIVEKLLTLGEKARLDIGDAEKVVVEGLDFFESRTFHRTKGSNSREPGQIENSK